MSFWNYRSIQNHMVSRLYNMRNAGGAATPGASAAEESEEEFEESTPPCCALFSNCCSSKVGDKRRAKAKVIASENLERELDLVEVIKQQRYFNEALKNLLTKEQRLQYKANANFVTVDPSSDDSKVAKVVPATSQDNGILL